MWETSHDQQRLSVARDLLAAAVETHAQLAVLRQLVLALLYDATPSARAIAVMLLQSDPREWPLPVALPPRNFSDPYHQRCSVLGAELAAQLVQDPATKAIVHRLKNPDGQMKPEDRRALLRLVPAVGDKPR